MKDTLVEENGENSSDVPLPRTLTGGGFSDKQRSNSRTTSRSKSTATTEAAFPRTLTGQLLRTMTLTGVVDEAWGEDAIADIENIAKKGHEGDTPEQPPFAKNILFWKMAINAAVMGVLLGLAGVVFINIIDKVPELWSDFSSHEGYDFEEEENVGFNDGKVMDYVCILL